MKKRLTSAVMAALCLILLAGCSSQPDGKKGEDPSPPSGGNTDFQVETYFERHEEVPGQYQLDIRIPIVNPLVTNADYINDTIFTDFSDILNLPEHTMPEDTGLDNPIYKIDYQVSNINGICALNVISSLTSGYGSGVSSLLHSYYYDENSGEILQKDTYLEAIGYTEEDIETKFNQKMKDQIGGELTYADILWYFDQANELQFIVGND